MSLMPNIPVWPVETLYPSNLVANLVPFTRTSGRTLGARSRSTRTDRGFWDIQLGGILLSNREDRKLWQAIRTTLSGRASLIAVPLWSQDSAPYASGRAEPETFLPHADDASFDDGSRYRQGAISVVMAEALATGDTRCKLRVVAGDGDVSGVHFSFDYAAYETGRILSEVGGVTEVLISPAARAPIPAGARLEFDMPTCLVRLADDGGMDLPLSHHESDLVSVRFVEAIDFWSDHAAGLT